METDTVSIDTFARVHGLTIKSEYADRNPNMPDSRDMDHWKVTLTRRAIQPQYDTWKGYKGKIKQPTIAARMTLHFSKGYWHNGKEPDVTEVLDCLASDACGLDNSPDFAQWCGEYGYDTDSRKALKIFKACEHSAARLRRFLGADLFETLVYHTER